MQGWHWLGWESELAGVGGFLELEIKSLQLFEFQFAFNCFSEDLDPIFKILENL